MLAALIILVGVLYLLPQKGDLSGLVSNPVDVPTATGKSIAVLPFSNLSNDPEQEYFSDGITEEIITSLAQLPSLKVIARTSVMSYKKTDKTIAQIGEELGVDHILEGSRSHHQTCISGYARSRADHQVPLDDNGDGR